MKFKLFISIFLIAGCANPAIDSNAVSNSDLDSNENLDVQVEVRNEIIASYSRPYIIDSSFEVDSHSYILSFRHFALMDSAIVVPARYNFDTNKDFVTHNFKSEISLVSGADTLFKKDITKNLFKEYLSPQLDSFASLLFPVIREVNDSITIGYSISIPVTDIGIPVSIRFDKKGNYRTSN